jgi:hypothetical protein
MRRFSTKEIYLAKAYAMSGGQALHVHRHLGDRRTAPRVFVEAFDRGESFGHLFDQDADRLARTARELRVGVILIENRFDPRQHVALVGEPLRKALALCEAEEKPVDWESDPCHPIL